MPTAVARYDPLMVGPDGYLPGVVRSFAAPGRPIQPGELVQVDASEPLTLVLPAPSEARGRTIAVTLVDGAEVVTWTARGGANVGSTASLAMNVGPHGGYTFASNGTAWRVVGSYIGE